VERLLIIGGVFIALSLAWGVVVDGFRPDPRSEGGMLYDVSRLGHGVRSSPFSKRSLHRTTQTLGGLHCYSPKCLEGEFSDVAASRLTCPRRHPARDLLPTAGRLVGAQPPGASRMKKTCRSSLAVISVGRSPVLLLACETCW